MKRIMLFMITLMLLLVSGCSKKEVEEIPGDALRLCLVKIETEGMGLVAAAGEGETLQFDEDSSSTSVYLNVPEGTELTIAAKESLPEYRFLRWMMNGDKYSEEREFTMTIEAPTDLIAVFGVFNDWDGPSASSIEEVKTIGDILGLPYRGYAVYEDTLVYVFELNGIIYRAIADIPADAYQAINEAFDDNKRFYELIAPLEVKLIENVSKAIPSQEKLDKYVGKSVSELLDEGFSIYYQNFDAMELGMEHGWFSYIVKLDGKIEYQDGMDVEKAIRDLKVVSITYEDLSNSITDLAE